MVWGTTRTYSNSIFCLLDHVQIHGEGRQSLLQLIHKSGLRWKWWETGENRVSVCPCELFSSAFSCPSQLLVQRPTVTSGLASDAETSAFNWILYQCHCIRPNSYNKSHILLLFSTVWSSSVSLNKPWCIEKWVPEVVPEEYNLMNGYSNCLWIT